MKKRTKLVTSISLAGALLLGTASAAFAEGSFTSSVTQVQPGFTSRAWLDKNSDGASTKITLSGCKANKGGGVASASAVTSVKVTLYRSGGIVAAKSIKCGTYDFGRVAPGNYTFKVSAINGNTATNRSTFLNANVSVSY